MGEDRLRRRIIGWCGSQRDAWEPWRLNEWRKRACYATSATGALLRTGHADAADALWRTLHELVVVAWLIKDHGLELAERFREFEYVEVWRNARAYQAVQGRLQRAAGRGYDPILRQEFHVLERKIEQLKVIYGDRYVSEDYGWALSILPKRKRARLDALERIVGIDHLRPFYRLGNMYAHATAHSHAERRSTGS